MNGGKTSKIYNSLLLNLKKTDGVKMIALGSREGFLISEQANEDMEMLTTMAATMLRAAENVTSKLEKVSANRVIVDFNGGKLIAASAGQKALISVMATADASIDAIISELERTSGRIKEIL